MMLIERIWHYLEEDKRRNKCVDGENCDSNHKENPHIMLWERLLEKGAKKKGDAKTLLQKFQMSLRNPKHL